MTDGHGGPVAPRKAVHRSRSDLRPLRILLVEDSHDNQLLVRAYLKDTPWRVDVASNGIAGVAKFRQARYDIVLMDVQLPLMDGVEATRAIRSWERDNGRAPAPVIVLTADADRTTREATLAAGGTSLLAKPIAKAELFLALREVSTTRRDDR
jgi:CheY-like chemotaxis protein